MEEGESYNERKEMTRRWCDFIFSSCCVQSMVVVLGSGSMCVRAVIGAPNEDKVTPA